jgi:protein O-GlcNAc transferase
VLDGGTEYFLPTPSQIKISDASRENFMMSSRAAWVRLVVLIGATDGVSGEWRQSLQTAFVTQQNGDLVGAAPHYREALKENPELLQHAPVLTNLGLAVQAEGHVEEALAAFQGALKLTPEDPNAYFNLARALTDSGEHREAQQALRSCLALSPQDAEAYYDLGLSLLQQKEAGATDEGVEAVRACVTLEPKDGKHWLALGDGLAAQKRWEESASAYTRACDLRPAHAPSWASLGNALEEQGSNADAEAHWRKAIALAKANDGGGAGADGGGAGADGGGGVQASWYLNLASMLRRADRMAEARTMYSSALGVEPTSVDAYMGLGRCHAPPTDSESEGARRYLQGLRDTYGAALDLQPDHAGAYTALGEAMRMYGLQGGCDEVRACLRAGRHAR